jgi:putative transposase
MTVVENDLYHIYNQGNNQELTFRSDDDYTKFLYLFSELVKPHCNTLAYCLMPNHFHFLINTTEVSATIKRVGNIDSCVLSNGFRLLQSTYAQYFNKKHKRSGSLFRQKAKAKSTSDGTENYHYTAFNYIHQNPLRAGLVTKMEEWRYSSFADYAGFRNENICDIALGEYLINFDKNTFLTDSYKALPENLIEKIYHKYDYFKKT